MADWYLNRALTNFRAAVNAAYPNRDKTSDGTIGDPAHAARSSDHNPDPAGEPDAGSVDAWDMDVDLRSGNDAAAIAALKRVFEAHPSSKYWIHNDQISFRNEGWRPRSYAYAGANRNKHTQHVHWNTRESHEDSTAPWILEDDMTKEEHDALMLVRWIVAAGMVHPSTGERVPLQAWGAGIDAALDAIATRPGLSAEELAAVKAEAMAGAAAGAKQALTPEALAAAIPDSLAAEVVDLLRARLAS